MTNLVRTTREVPSNPRFIADSRAILHLFAQHILVEWKECFHRIIPLRAAELESFNRRQFERSSVEPIAQSLAFVSPIEIHVEMETLCVRLGTDLLSLLEEKLFPPILRYGADLSDFKERYKFSEATKAQESARIRSVLTHGLAGVYAQVNRLERIHDYLKVQLPTIQAQANKSIDWGERAMDTGAAVLTIGHPLIGIPALLARWASTSKRNTAKSKILEEYGIRLKEYFEQWAMLANIYDPIYKSQCRYLEERLSNFVNVVIPGILSEMDAAGISVKPIADSYRQLIKGNQKEIL